MPRKKVSSSPPSTLKEGKEKTLMHSLKTMASEESTVLRNPSTSHFSENQATS